MQNLKPLLAQVVVNGRFLNQPATGVQRLALGVLNAIDKILSDMVPANRLRIEVLVPFLSGPPQPWHTIPVRHAPGGRGYWWEQVTLPRAAAGRLIINFCNLAPLIAPGVVCIHDANVFTIPQNYSWRFRWVYRIFIPIIARSAKRVVTVSRYSANQLAVHGVIPADRITIIPNAIDYIRNLDSGQSRLDVSTLPDRYVFAIGSVSANKNTNLLLSIGPALKRIGIALVIAGDVRGAMFARETIENTENVMILGRVHDNDLPVLFQRALCLAFPSFEEGFGLPPLEAMNWGCPVIASDRASMPEVCGNAALFCSPYDPAQWIAAISQLATDVSLRASLIERGRARAALYTFASSGAAWLRLIEEELAQLGRPMPSNKELERH